MGGTISTAHHRKFCPTLARHGLGSQGDDACRWTWPQGGEYFVRGAGYLSRRPQVLAVLGGGAGPRCGVLYAPGRRKVRMVSTIRHVELDRSIVRRGEVHGLHHL